ncbi:peroxide stress protein YaaA [Anianabacter salinae]|uniref:peroxide stress protein YaaA n=1 Tax=Anianabacter salinae TaxID=2851023 RepID=UPI00225E50A6|nr:peroxide stress protein YaaA [Anianabacter salinae]MBV0913408.1 peroxide stress protein YaaA [Anianabacter salinae]
MLVVISPAKRLDMEDVPGASPTEPRFLPEANRLAAHARQLTLGKLRDLMDISDDLARLNRDRFRAFADEPGPEATHPAMYAFAGDTYQGLEARSLDPDAVAYAQDHLRILSGLYGVLRPLDAIQPYRLEMGSRLKTRRGGSLYDFWRDLPAKALNADADAVGTDTLINCASQEYFGAVDRKALKLRVIEPVFMEEKGGSAKIVSFFAKKARGAMARFVVENRIADPDGIKDFTSGGYRFVSAESDGDRWVFIRPETQETED